MDLDFIPKELARDVGNAMHEAQVGLVCALGVSKKVNASIRSLGQAHFLCHHLSFMAFSSH
jgi:hypothetical protein